MKHVELFTLVGRGVQLTLALWHQKLLCQESMITRHGANSTVEFDVTSVTEHA